MITSRQIRAARALLDWTQKDLARTAGLHLNAITNIEKGHNQPRPATLQYIQQALEAEGVHFKGAHGVEISEEVFEISRIQGDDFIARVAQDTIACMRKSKGDVLVVVADEQQWDIADKKANALYYKAMKKIGFRERIIAGRNSRVFSNPDRASYRWLSEKAIGSISYFVYANRVGFIRWPAKEVLFIRSQALAETFRGQFDHLWAAAKPFEKF